MHYEGVPLGIYYVIAEFASVQIIFGATVHSKKRYFQVSFMVLQFVTNRGPAWKDQIVPGRTMIRILAELLILCY